MNKDYLSQGELQHIEHCNKVLKDHLALVQAITNESEKLLNTFLPIVGDYVNQVGAVTHQMGLHVKNIYASSRELKQAVGGTQDLISFMDAVMKVDKLLTPELLEKLRKVSQ